MKSNRLIALIIEAVVIAFPLQIAYLGMGEYGYGFRLLMFLVTVFGSLSAIFIGLETK